MRLAIVEASSNENTCLCQGHPPAPPPASAERKTGEVNMAPKIPVKKAPPPKGRALIIPRGTTIQKRPKPNFILGRKLHCGEIKKIPANSFFGLIEDRRLGIEAIALKEVRDNLAV